MTWDRRESLDFQSQPTSRTNCIMGVVENINIRLLMKAFFFFDIKNKNSEKGCFPRGKNLFVAVSPKL